MLQCSYTTAVFSVEAEGIGMHIGEAERGLEPLAACRPCLDGHSTFLPAHQRGRLEASRQRRCSVDCRSLNPMNIRAHQQMQSHMCSGLMEQAS